MLQIVKYMKFSWKEQNNVTKSSLIGISFDQDTGFIKIRWLDRSALPVNEEVVSLIKYIVENELGRLKEKYIPSGHSRIIERYGASNCLDVIIIEFPYYDFEDFGYVSGKIHVSMYQRLNEPIIFEGNVWNLIKLLERLSTIVRSNSDDFEEIKNLNVKEFTPWGESLRKIREKQIEKINENFEYEKF